MVFPFDFTFDQVAENIVVRDSKLLSKKQRQAVYEIIELYSLQIEIEVISPNDINVNGINWANTIGFSRLINKIQSDKYIVDGRWKIPNLGNKLKQVECIINADEFIPATLAAGIVAKVKRDEIIMQLHTMFPMYSWDTNTGHGTKKHMKSILEYGICEYHKTQFVETALKNIKKNGTIL